MDAGRMLEPEKSYGKAWKYYEDSFEQVGDIRTRYWSEGEGDPTLLLIHGYGAAVEEWAWNIAAFSARYKVVALDIPGFGLADKPEAPYTYEFFADFVDAFMEARGISRAHVMGHSMGGAIALNLALRHPERARSLTLVAPAFGRIFPFAMRLATLRGVGEFLLRPPAAPKDIVAAFGALTHAKMRWADITLERFFHFRQEAGYAAASLKYLRNYLNIFGLRPAARELEAFYEKAIPDLAAPTFLVWGPQDRVVSFSASAELRTLLPAVEFWSPDPCGHCPNFEYPEEFNARALDFLARH